MRLLSWNVQWCRGMDGAVDPARIAAYIREQAADIVCLQEVAVNFPDMPGGAGADQVSELQAQLPGYTAFYIPAVDLPGASGGRSPFGNAILSRLPVGRVLRHSLPWPPSPDSSSMPRAAIEAVIAGVRVITTHLEYHSSTHRAAQIRGLREILAEGRAVRRDSAEANYRAAARPETALVCGDFNLPPEDPLHAQMVEELADAWQVLHPSQPHPPTFRLYEEKHRPYCCDFVFVTPDLAPRLKAIRIDAANQASDHQPVMVDFR